ncbi:hypothetical protein BDW68DRAFT_165495 [Aspergillus falconensis]
MLSPVLTTPLLFAALCIWLSRILIKTSLPRPSSINRGTRPVVIPRQTQTSVPRAAKQNARPRFARHRNAEASPRTTRLGQREPRSHPGFLHRFCHRVGYHLALSVSDMDGSEGAPGKLRLILTGGAESGYCHPPNVYGVRVMSMSA